VASNAIAQAPSAPVPSLRPELESLLDHMVRTHGFDANALRELLTKVQTNSGVQRAVAAPATAKPWYEFKPLFVDEARISGGVRYWSEHAETLERARRDFGVPEAIVVALIGIETRYGRVTGSFRVIDALATLAFDVPGRKDYFRGELEQFLLLARDQSWDPLAVRGSYAGAMGVPQFMPSSYRRYAVDFSGDGKIDLWSDPADVIGSVAAYLRQFGWKDGAPVVIPARVETTEAKALLELGLKPSLSLEQWRQRGVEPMSAVDGSALASLFSLDLVGGAEYWLGLDSFYALLQYNRSRNYAMAVLQLAAEIARERERTAAIAPLVVPD
jgi:membrane-bound lytic murein transglycosylase B